MADQHIQINVILKVEVGVDLKDFPHFPQGFEVDVAIFRGLDFAEQVGNLPLEVLLTGGHFGQDMGAVEAIFAVELVADDDAPGMAQYLPHLTIELLGNAGNFAVDDPHSPPVLGGGFGFVGNFLQFVGDDLPVDGAMGLHVEGFSLEDGLVEAAEPS